MKKTSAGKSLAAPKKAALTEKKTKEKRTNLVADKPQSAKKPASAPKPVAAGPQAALSAPKANDLTGPELENFKERLLVIRAQLRGNVITMTDAALNKNRMEASGDLSAMPIHMADIGSDNFEQEQTLSFMQSEHGLLEKVDEALTRMKGGKFGICEGCECWIPRARLNAIPYAAKCVTCAASDEQDD